MKPSASRNILDSQQSGNCGGCAALLLGERIDAMVQEEFTLERNDPWVDVSSRQIQLKSTQRHNILARDVVV